MHDPVTTIDPRFSDPAAVPTTWEEARRVLDTAELFWLATVRADGRPHVTPLVAVWFEGAIYFSTGVHEQKALNLRANPHVVLTTGCNDWNKGLDVVVEGDAVLVTGKAALERIAQAWTPKWDGRWQYVVTDEGFQHAEVEERILVFSVTPVKVFAHGKGDPFSQTRHRF